MQIKICGITSEKEINKLNELKADYAGFVLFFEKSKRNLDLITAAALKDKLKYSKSVAVTVSPSLSEAEEIERAGFDILQVHGELAEEIKNNCKIMIWRAVNISNQSFEEIKNIVMDRRISAVVFDGADSGSGESFDWNMFKPVLKQCKAVIAADESLDEGSEKEFVLAGGLNPDNVSMAVDLLAPDIVDVSSGVEFDDKNLKGKDLCKVEKFIINARGII